MLYNKSKERTEYVYSNKHFLKAVVRFGKSTLKEHELMEGAYESASDPDVHLKPYMFERVNELLESNVAECAVCLMDIPDDWNKEFNIEAYVETYDALFKFIRNNPNTLWCYRTYICVTTVERIKSNEMKGKVFRVGKMQSVISDTVARKSYMEVDFNGKREVLATNNCIADVLTTCLIGQEMVLILLTLQGFLNCRLTLENLLKLYYHKFILVFKGA